MSAMTPRDKAIRYKAGRSLLCDPSLTRAESIDRTTKALTDLEATDPAQAEAKITEYAQAWDEQFPG